MVSDFQSLLLRLTISFTASRHRSKRSSCSILRIAMLTGRIVVAAAQVGYHNEKRESYGHSIIVGPWGEVLAELGGEFKDSKGKAGPEIATATVDTKYVEKIRREVPLRRRWDVYAEL